MDSVLHIHLLGDFRLLLGELPILTVNTARLQSLLAYLVLHRDSPQPRSRLAFLLWPDSTEAQAQANLRNLIFQLRRALPDTDLFLKSDGRTLQWRSDAPFTLDTADYEDAIAMADRAEHRGDARVHLQSLQRAIDLYRGDLLPSSYDEWVFSERESLRESFTNVAGKLVRLLEWRHDYAAAINYAQRLVRHDPLRETTYHDLMRLYALVGDRAGALRAYHSCATVLERELGIEPNEAIREDYERLLKAGSHDVGRRSAENQQPQGPPLERGGLTTSPLVGRRPEWALLLEAWHAATGTPGGPRLALLVGEAGIGKTRHAEELIEWASRQGIAVANTRCYAAEGALGFAPVVNWLRARSLAHLEAVWRGELARLLPELLTEQNAFAPPTPLTEPWQRQRLFEAIARALLGSPGQPLLLVIDDLQWCDHDTLEFLRFLLRYDPRARLLVVGTARSEELDGEHPLARLRTTLRQAGALTEIELEPLDASETADLAARIIRGQPDASAIAELFRQTEGNPLFIVEMARAGLLHDAVHLPSTVHSVIAARLSQLSTGARNLAELAATIGREFTFDVLAKASSWGASSSGDEGLLVQQLDELWQRRIVREQKEQGQWLGNGAYDFTHDKLREVAYESLSSARRRLLHHHVARALEAVHVRELDRVSGQIAAHYEQAGLPERAASYYGRAAGAARLIFSNEEALAYFRHALELVEAFSIHAPEHDWQREAAQLDEGMADILEWMGRNEQAKSAYDLALARVPINERVWRARLQRKAGWALRNQGLFSETLQELLAAEATLGQPPSDIDQEWWQEWVQIRLDHLDVLYNEGRASDMPSLIESTRHAVKEYASLPQRVEFYRALVEANHRRDRYAISAETMSYYEQALGAAKESGDMALIAQTQFRMGFGLLCRRNLKEAEEMFLAALLYAEMAGKMRLQAVCLVYMSTIYRLRGQVEETRELSARAMAAAAAAETPTYTAAAKANLAWVVWRKGGLAEARGQLEDALEAWRQMEMEFPFHWLAIWPLVAIALVDGRVGEGVETARGLLRQTQQLLPATLEEATENAIQAWDADQERSASSWLQTASGLAKEKGYL